MAQKQDTGVKRYRTEPGRDSQGAASIRGLHQLGYECDFKN
jgi:hypothetical protein